MTAAQTWSPRNKGVRAEYNPDPYPEFGQCVHNLAMHPSTPNVLFQQSHDGMYRTDNHGDDWVDIGDGKLPSRWGFPVDVHPTDPRTVYVVPEESGEYHMSVDGKFTVWRSRDAGETWQPMRKGLPDNARLVVLREAMSTDTFRRCGHLRRHQHRAALLQPRLRRLLGADGGFPSADPFRRGRRRRHVTLLTEALRRGGPRTIFADAA